MKPLNRRETFLARMAGEDVTLPEPLTREEAYMKATAEAINGVNDVTTPEPLTREEHYKKTIIEKLVDATSDLIEKTVTENGTYTAKSDNADGYSKVTVNVPFNAKLKSGTGDFPSISKRDLEKIEIPQGFTGIAANAFNSCTDLTEVTIPNTVTSIGEKAFNGCTGLTEITIPSSVTSIASDEGLEAFIACDNLATITIDKAEGSITGAPWGATNAQIIWNG